MSINVNVGGNTGPLERDVRAAMDRINRAGGLKIRVDDKGVTQPLGNMKRSADEFSKSLEASNARVLAFGASVGIINAVSNAFKGLVEQTIKVEKNLTDINVVMGLTSKQLDKFGGGLFKVAAETGAGFQAASEAATEFARQGLSVAETLKRTKDALILTRLTGMKATESVKSLTAAMNTFKGEVHDSTVLVSKFAAVDVKFAVSAEDFAQAIARAGASARDAGVDINELIGVVAAVQERTARGGAVIGNAFKTIFTRLRRSSTLQQLEDIGIAVRDVKGSTLPAMKILDQLAKRYSTLTDAQQSYVAQNVAGVFQINMLKAAMADLGQANSVTAQATEIASKATDESSQKNEQLRNTMAALATETGVAIQELAKKIGDIALAPGINKILDGVKGVADWANNLLGDGEQEGNRFAKGLLAGVGNFLSGPGLVVLTAVVSKLFVNAAKYGVQSLQSLLGMNKAATARKHTEQAILQVMASNSALSKEMLRTDISREKKEQMILALIRQQTTEAQKLAAVSKQLTLPLVRAGVTPNLSMRRAEGFIPNFAADKSERQLAQQAGYSAGAIKQMNIPGVGDVTYNTAETVKKFPGMTQPAIVPPEESRAAGPYNAAFMGAHGFSPYAATGHIPNFAIGSATLLKSWNSKGRDAGDRLTFNHPNAINYAQRQGYIASKDANNLLKKYASSGSAAKMQQSKAGAKSQALAAMLVPKEGYGGPSSSYRSKTTGNLTWPVYKISSKGKMRNANIEKALMKRVDDIGGDYTLNLSRTLEELNFGSKMGAKNAFSRKWDNDTAGGATGAVGSMVGSIFEAATNAALNYSAQDFDGAEGDFDVRGGEFAKIRKAFNIEGGALKYPLADFKNNSTTKGNRKSFHDKVVKQNRFNKVNPGGPKNAAKISALGYVPNYADPLSDAIGRERGAGVPVSKIRVGSHRALQASSNPMGLGVTNTTDEPRGLKDVFGASGFVPNYAFGQVGKFLSSYTGKGLERLEEEAKRAAEKLRKTEQALGTIPEELKQLRAEKKKLKEQVRKDHKAYLKGNMTKKQLDASAAKLNQVTSQSTTLTSRLNKATANLSRARDRASTSERAAARGRKRTGGSGLGSMGAMMALSMGAGMVNTEGENAKSFGAQASSGAMSGAATGMAVGMMFGPIGMAAGAAAGGLYGLLTASDKVAEAKAKERKALEESNKAIRDNIKAFNNNSMAQSSSQAFSSNILLKRLQNQTGSSGFLDMMSKDNYKALVNNFGGKGKDFAHKTPDASQGFVPDKRQNALEQYLFKDMNLQESVGQLRKISTGAIESGKLYDRMMNPKSNSGADKEAIIKAHNAKGNALGFASERDKNSELQLANLGDMGDRQGAYAALIKSLDLTSSFQFNPSERVSNRSDGKVSGKLGPINYRISGDYDADLADIQAKSKNQNTFLDNQSRLDKTYAGRKRMGLVATTIDPQEAARDHLDDIIASLFSDSSEASKSRGVKIQKHKTVGGKIEKDGEAVKINMTGQDIANIMQDENATLRDETAAKFGMETGTKGVGRKNLEEFRQKQRAQLEDAIENNDKVQEQERKQLNFLRVKAISDAQFQAQKNQLDRDLVEKNKTNNAALELYSKSLTATAKGQMKHNMEQNKINSRQKQAQLNALKTMKNAFIQKSQDTSSGLGQEMKNVFESGQGQEGLEKILGKGGLQEFNNLANAGELDKAVANIDPEKFRQILVMVNEQNLLNDSIKRFYEAQDELRDSAFEKAKGEKDLAEDKLDNERDINKVLEDRVTIAQKLKELQESRDTGKAFADKYSSLMLENQDLQGQMSLARIGGGTATQQYNFARNQATVGYNVKRAFTVEDRENTARKRIQTIMKGSGFEENMGAESMHTMSPTELLAQARLHDKGNAETLGEGVHQSLESQLENVEKMIQGNGKLLEQEDERFKNMQELVKIQHEFVHGQDAFANGMQMAFKDANDRAATFSHRLGKVLPETFSKNMSDAMMKVIREGSDWEDAMRGAAIGVLDQLNQMFTQQIMDQAFGSMFDEGEDPALAATMSLDNAIRVDLATSISNLSSNISSLTGAINSMPKTSVASPSGIDQTDTTKKTNGNYQGGPVRLNKGGQVPSMLTNGEFVMGKEAVSRLGIGNMNLMNQGKIPKFNEGGFAEGFGNSLASGAGAMASGLLMKELMGDPEDNHKKWTRPKDAFEQNRAWKRNKMSAHFMRNSSGVRTEVGEARQAREKELQKWIAKQEEKQALGRQIVGIIGNAVTAGAMKEFGSDTGWGSKVNEDGTKVSAFDRVDAGLGINQMGAKMQNWALDKQGYNVGDGPHNFVDDSDYAKMDAYNQNKKDIARRDGKSWLEKTMSWTGRQALYSGGNVSGPAGIDKVPAMLTEGEYVINANAARKIGMPALEKINAGRFNEGGLVGETTKSSEASSAGGMTNNINISVNVEGGNAKDGAKSGDSSGSDKKTRMDDLSKKIKQQVVMVIKEENRPGGLLG